MNTGEYSVPHSGVYMFTAQKLGYDKAGSFYFMVDNKKQYFVKVRLKD